MEVLLLAVMGAVNIACFIIGAKVGQTVSKGEDIKTPTIHPIEAARNREEKKLAQMEQNRIDTIMRNIERYDGTTKGQEDVPRG
ncbi:MAG: hypothetical protein J6B01_06655 [Ruminococcus sp.]|nr:hypothetical protein [Bacteroidaceae bacterium]MBO5319467.1 hypothetical protein [Ruminococcus sp.]